MSVWKPLAGLLRHVADRLDPPATPQALTTDEWRNVLAFRNAYDELIADLTVEGPFIATCPSDLLRDVGNLIAIELHGRDLRWHGIERGRWP